MLVSNELKQMWKGMVITQFKVVCQHVLGAIEENYKRNKNDLCSSRYLNRQPP